MSRNAEWRSAAARIHELISTASQGGLASLLSMLAAAGLGVEYLRDFPKLLQAVTVDDVQEAASTYLTPKDLTAVVVGDWSVIGDSVSTLVEVERA